jgi:hypothetical protein
VNLGTYLRQILLGDAAVAALVDEKRVYSEVLPQRPTTPAIVFSVVSGGDDEELEGPSGARTRRLQIDVWAKTRDEATALTLAVRPVLAEHAGAAAGFEFQGAFIEDEQWFYDDEAALFRTMLDVSVTTSGVEA